MPSRARLDTGLSGVAGEYFVAAELTRQGYIASLTLKNTKGIDVLASSSDGSKQVAIQVKCEQGSGTEWILNKKSDGPLSNQRLKLAARVD